MRHPLAVLILEDNPDDAELMAIELTAAGFDPECTRVEDESGFRAALRQAPDVLIADYHLPQFDALAALEVAVEVAPEVPVIVVSGVMDEETCVRCLRHGAIDYLLKDRLTRLGPAVGHALERRAREAARNRAEQAARDATSILQSLVDGAPTPIYLVDEVGRFVLVNRAFETAFGSSRDHLVGRTALDAIAGATAGSIVERDRRCLADRTVQETEEVLPGPAGPRTFVSIRYPMSIHGGSPAVAAVYTDISRQKETESELRAAKADLREQADVLAEANAELQKLDTMRSRFIATVSHELRTPLTSILSFTQVLEDEDLSAGAHEIVRTIDRNGQRLLDLIETLLAFAKIEGDAIRLNLTEVDPAELVETCRAAIEPAARAAGVELAAHLPANLPVVRADRQQLERVLLNLLSNAVKFSPGGGTTTITVNGPEHGPENGDTITIAVRDSGIGIPPDEVKHIFTRFFRSSTAEQRAIGGTGLGLAISKAIVENHDGQIGIQSCPRAGTTVTVTLPTAGPRIAEDSG
jgi:PAS domain S-box-containing protein